MLGGRPRKYKTVEDLEKAVNDYFESIQPVEEKNEKGKVVAITGGEPPTIAGLTLFLGFADKSTLYDYRDREGFSHPIKRAIMMIEKHHEISLNGKSPTGNIFALKNMGWRDKQEHEHSGKDGGPIETKTTIERVIVK